MESIIIVWQIAAAEATAGNAAMIEPSHLLMGVCKICDLALDSLFSTQSMLDPSIRENLEFDINYLRQMFTSAGFNHTYFRRRLRAHEFRTSRSIPVGKIMHRSDASRRIFQRAEEIAKAQAPSNPLIRLNHLLQALFEFPNPVWQNILIEMGMPDLPNRLFGNNQVIIETAGEAENGEDQFQQPALKITRERTTPYLKHFGRDLTQLATNGQLDPVIGRREEMRSLARVLTQKRKRNAILVGEAGVGKTAVIEGLAQRLVSSQAPSGLEGKRLIEVSMASLVAGTRHRGEFEERMQSLLSEASTGNDVILFIDEIHTVLGAGGEGASDAANILKPALARGDLHCIGATTTREYRRYIEKDPALERRFQVVWIEEPSREEAISILNGLKTKFEEHHGLEITDGALDAAVELSMRYLPDFHLPDKAIDLIDQACSVARIVSLSVHSELPATTSISREEIAAVVAERCRIPLTQLTENEKDRLLNMENDLQKYIAGQEEAIRTVSEGIRAARAGLKDPQRPAGVFLFVGSSGTGKTVLAKTLASYLFHDEQQLIRIDMSEYMERHTISRLIGSPPGYIGYDEEGQLTSSVRSHPYSVVLFDEIEKAHPDVLNILLQILDEGRLTDSHGRTVSFVETTIILTSNLGSVQKGQSHNLGFRAPEADSVKRQFDKEAYRQQVKEALQHHLRPELLNRIQQIVYFYPLDQEALRLIVDKILENVRARLKSRKVDLTLSNSVYDLIIAAGYDPAFGARELERAVDRLLVIPLGQALLSGHFQEGTILHVNAVDNEIILEDVKRTRAISLSRLQIEGSEN